MVVQYITKTEIQLRIGLAYSARLRVPYICTVNLMSSYTWDPAQGAAVETSQITNSNDNQETDYQGQADILAEVNREETARYLSSQHGNTSGVDVNSTELLSLQRELSAAADSGDLLRVEALEKRCYELASGLVSGKPSQLPVNNGASEDTSDARETFEDHARDKYPNLDETLDYAAENLPSAVSDTFNQFLSNGTDEEKSLTVNMLNQFEKQGGKGFNTTDQHSVLSGNDANEVISRFGDEIGGQVVTLSAAIASGHASVSDAISLAARSPKLLTALIEGSRDGLFEISL